MPRTELPKLARPARRALAAAGIDHLEDLAEHTESEIASLHGMGPNGMGQLRDALGVRGLAFKPA